uniref:E3 ubiquitin protein ligase n=1 Tax=Cyprinus carpio carpio TaxID=630221 RepID=A0A8C1ATP5_CYPCA
MSAQKRPTDPPEKKKSAEDGARESSGSGGSTATAVETVIKLGGGSNQEEQDIKALQIKNRKLVEALDQRQVIEDELRERVERLETRQATDDASLLILNRFWNQFDENVRLIVRRYDQSGSEPVESQPPEGRSLKPGTPEPDGDSNQERAKDRGGGRDLFSGHVGQQQQEQLECSCKQARRVVEISENLKNTVDQLKKDMESGTDGSLWDVAVCLNTLLTNENERLRQLTDSLQQKHSHMTSESRPLGRAANRADNRISELQVLIEELQWGMEKIRRRENRLNTHLAEVLERVNSKGYKVYGEASSACGTITINKRKFEEMNSELEESKELADNRLGELQKLQQDLQTVYQENNNMKVELLSRAEEVARESAEYRCLQSQFSVVYNESLVLKFQLDETKARLNTTRTPACNDEVSLQRKVRTEVIQLEDTLAHVRKEYEMLRIEFEQTLAANEQAGPINREMRHLISTLQTHNQQLKGEVVKYKLRLRETQQELDQLRAAKGNAAVQSQSSTEMDVKEEIASLHPSTPTGDVTMKTEPDSGSATPSTTGVTVKTEPGTDTETVVKEEEKEKEKDKEKEKEQREKERVTRGSSGGVAVKEEREKSSTSSSQSEDLAAERCAVIGGPKRKEMEQLKVVRVELKKAQESQREMKLLLDMYRSAPKEQRDKVQLMAAEKKAKSEAEELRQRVRELEERERREGKKMADEEALRKIRSVEQQIDILNKKTLSFTLSQEEDALLSEMDVTGQAFEDMQEQNIRLMQQLREKDDGNFKLMSERIKSNQIHKLLKEEKEELADQLLALKTQVDAQLQVVRKLEEKERLLQGTISAVQESVLLSEEVRTQLEAVQQRLSAVREEVVENSNEDISKLRRKIEKAKKPAENIRNGDEILNEEINDYKARLTCPCCNSRVKDAVLTKCFHVFCFECVKTRYDTRQRKCPKCNAAFGANDFHRIYIG